MRTITIKLIGNDAPINLYIDEFGEDCLENDILTEDFNFVRIHTIKKIGGEKDRKIILNKSIIESIVIKEINEESDF